MIGIQFSDWMILFLYLHENTLIKSGGNGDDWRILNYMLILAVLLFRFFYSC